MGPRGQALAGGLQRLTPEERALYDDLRDNRIQVGLRLEQEHIGFNWLASWLGGLLDQRV